MVKGHDGGRPGRRADDLGAFAVVVLNDFPMIEKVEVRALKGTGQQFKAVCLKAARRVSVLPLLFRQQPGIMDRHLPLIKDNPFHAAVAAVRIAAEEHFAVAVERTVKRGIEVVEPTQTVSITGGRCCNSRHAFSFQAVSGGRPRFDCRSYRPPASYGKASSST